SAADLRESGLPLRHRGLRAGLPDPRLRGDHGLPGDQLGGLLLHGARAARHPLGSHGAALRRYSPARREVVPLLPSPPQIARRPPRGFPPGGLLLCASLSSDLATVATTSTSVSPRIALDYEQTIGRAHV